MADIITAGRYPGEFPVPQDPVALLDIDATLIDTSYEVTDTQIYPAIQEAQEAGWTIGLSSDTPYGTMVERARQFGIKDGPLIAEKSGLVVRGDWRTEPVPGIGEAFLASRQRIAEHLADSGLVVWSGNPADVLHSGVVGQPGDTVVLINDRRQYGMSYYFRRVTEGGMVKDDALTDELVDRMRPFFPDYDDLDEDKNHDYGMLIVNRKILTKRIGTQALMSQMRVSQVAMIGNSYADYIGNDIAVHYAVGDSHDAFKNVADYTATAPLTGGSVEILRKLYE